MTTKTKFIHKCSVTWSAEDKIWVVSDRSCGEFSENKNWRRAVLVANYHFILELEAGISRVLKANL